MNNQVPEVCPNAGAVNTEPKLTTYIVTITMFVDAENRKQAEELATETLDIYEYDADVTVEVSCNCDREDAEAEEDAELAARGQ
jgi:hypothetical protein